MDISDFCDNCREHLHESVGKKFLRDDGASMYGDLLAGFQNADHQIFSTIAKIIPEHLRPSDFLPEFSTNDGGELSVVSLAFFFHSGIKIVFPQMV